LAYDTGEYKCANRNTEKKENTGKKENKKENTGKKENKNKVKKSIISTSPF